MFFKIKKYYSSSYRWPSKNIGSLKSLRPEFIKRCFTTIKSKRPVRNLYYKISRSRPIVNSMFPYAKSKKDLSLIVGNPGGYTLFRSDSVNKYRDSLGVHTKDPVNSCVLKSVDFDTLLSGKTKLSIKKLRGIKLPPKRRLSANSIVISKRRRVSVRNKFIRVKYIPLFRYIFTSSKFDRLIKFHKSRKISLTYFMWYNMMSFVARSTKINSYDSFGSVYDPKLRYYSNSNLTGVCIYTLSNKTKLNSIKGRGLAASTVSIYNVKTYNWLITI